MLKIRKAIIEELPFYGEFIKEAVNFQHSQGFVQWTDVYPAEDLIRDDIKNGIGYAFTEEDKPVGYCVLIFDGDEAYDKIKGKWKTDKNFAVVHRIMFGDSARGKGYGVKAFSLLKELCIENGFNSIRIDTKEDNAVMRHVLEKSGFEYCGEVDCHGKRMAFELVF